MVQPPQSQTQDPMQNMSFMLSMMLQMQQQQQARDDRDWEERRRQEIEILWKEEELRKETRQREDNLVQALLRAQTPLPTQASQEDNHEERYAKKRANERINQLAPYKQNQDIPKYLDLLEIHMERAGFPMGEWKYIVQSKMPDLSRDAFLNSTADESVTYSTYKQTLLDTFGGTWKHATTKLYNRLPHTWKDLQVLDFLSTLQRTFVSLFTDSLPEQTLAEVMRSWIWERLLDENKKMLGKVNITTLQDLYKECINIAEVPVSTSERKATTTARIPIKESSRAKIVGEAQTGQGGTGLL